eukprot:15225079-Ditylum_brightwellii.AAC.1
MLRSRDLLRRCRVRVQEHAQGMDGVAPLDEAHATAPQHLSLMSTLTRAVFRRFRHVVTQ